MENKPCDFAIDYDNIISHMTLKEKALQLSQIAATDVVRDADAVVTGISYTGLSQEDLGSLGSALNFSGIDAANKLRSAPFAKKDNPLLLMQDVVHGYKTVYPLNIAIGGTFDLELAERCAEMSAIEARANGVNVTFAPMVDLVRDARWGRVNESTGEDPYLNGLMGRAAIRGYRKGGIACCIKHFAAYGAAESGRDYNTTDIGNHALYEYYLKSYIECLKEKPDMVMTSFNLLNGIPMNGHTELLVDLLRKQEGFEGVVISDWSGIGEMIAHGYAEDRKECARIAANNQIDIDMASLTYAEYLPELVREGKVSEEKVNGMVRRVLRLKEKLGLYRDASTGISAEKDKTYCMAKEAREIARKAAEDGSVLLENNGVLPLKKDADICLIGPYAQTRELMGEWACLGKTENVVSVREGIEGLTGRRVATASACSAHWNAVDESGFDEALRVAAESDIIVACMGEHCKESGESHSRSHISLADLQVKLLRKLKETGKKIVLVLFAGRPLALTEVAPLADAVLFCWHPGVEGGNAIADLLYGEANPNGKITMSFPRSVGQCPIYYNYFSTGRPKNPDSAENYLYTTSYLDELNLPLYPFGYGLSYTKFELSEIEISSGEMQRGERVIVSAMLKNAGKRDGREVVQLYIHDKFGSCARPVKELKGFQKIALAAGEERRVRFEIFEETLAYFTASGEYKAEAGDFEIMLGTNSRDVLKTNLRLIDGSANPIGQGRRLKNACVVRAKSI